MALGRRTASLTGEHCSGRGCPAIDDQCGAFAAASMMTAATSFGFDSIGTWLALNSVVVAFIRDDHD